MAKVYQCGNCDNEVKYGAKFCDECGTKLEWPEKKEVATVKVHNNKKIKSIVKLNVDPFAVDKLYESSLGLSIGVLFLGVLGIIFAPIIWYQRYIIGKWLKHLIKPNSTIDEVTTERMINRVMTIRIVCAIIFALNIIFCFGSLGMPSKATGYFGQTYDYTAIKVIGFLTNGAGIIVAEVLSQRAIKVIRSHNNGKKYEFDRERKYTDEDYE